MLWWLPTLALAGPISVQPLVLDDTVEVRVVPDTRWQAVQAVLLTGAGRETRTVTADEVQALDAWLALPRPGPTRLTLCGAVDVSLARAAGERLRPLEPVEEVDWSWAPPAARSGPAARHRWRLLDALPTRCDLAAGAPAGELTDLAAWTLSLLEEA